MTSSISTTFNPFNQIPPNWVSVADYQQAVINNLSPPTLAYLMSDHLDCHLKPKSSTDYSILDQYFWQPKVMAAHSVNIHSHLINTTSAVPLNIQLEHPLFLSPVAHHKLFHHDGELATLLASQITNTMSIWSSFGNTYFSDLLPKSTDCYTGSLNDLKSQQTNAVQWYWQIDPNKPSKATDKAYQRQYNLQLIQQLYLTATNFLVITVDATHGGVRHNIRRHGFILPNQCKSVNIPVADKSLQFNSANHFSKNNQPSNIQQSNTLEYLLTTAPTWQDIEWLVQRCNIPVILKGILHPDDAIQAQKIGCAGIIVSNHGKRVLNDSIQVATVLPQIRERVPQMIILADGSIQTGSDVGKLLALGADAVGIGRPYIYGLSMAGALGVAHMIKILTEELQVTMANIGAKKLSDLSNHLHRIK